MAQDPQKNKLDAQYQCRHRRLPSADRFPQAADRLEKPLPYAPRSYEMHELLGMIYASLSQDSRAIEHLKLAVEIKPDSAEARTNLGASLLHGGKSDAAGEQFQKALALEPGELRRQP